MDLIESTDLSKGIKLVNSKIPNALSFTIGFTFAIGTKDEANFPIGISHFLEHAIFRGSENYNAKEISFAFESKGAYINAYTSKDSICFYVKALNHHFDDVLGLMAEIIYKPTFDKDELAKEKAVIIEEIKATQDDYEDQIFDRIDEIIFKESMFAEQIAGNVKSVKAISDADIRAFHSQMINEAELCISVVGSFEMAKLKEKISKVVPNLSQNRTIHSDVAIEKQSFDFPERLQKKAIPSFQSHLLIAAPVYSYTFEQRNLLLLVNTILGEGMSSILYQNLREKLGLTYNVYSSLTLYKNFGAFYIYCGLDKSNIEDASQEVLKQLALLIKSGVPEELIVVGKEQLKSSLIFETENQSFVMQHNAKNLLYYSRVIKFEETLKDIDNITKQDVDEAVRSYFGMENLFRLDYLQKK